MANGKQTDQTGAVSALFSRYFCLVSALFAGRAAVSVRFDAPFGAGLAVTAGNLNQTPREAARVPSTAYPVSPAMRLSWVPEGGGVAFVALYSSEYNVDTGITRA
jgi:hypothetical protein